MWPLKYQTSAQKFLLGQFLSTDGNTAATGLTISCTDVTLVKQGSTAIANKSTTALAHESSGFYGGQWSSDDTDTYGQLTAFIHIATALMLKQEFLVVSSQVYNSMIAGTDVLDVNVSTMGSGVISSAQISSGALYSSAHILSSVAFSSGALSSVALTTAAWDLAANSVWTAARASYVSTLTMGWTQSTLRTYSSANFSSGFLSSLSFGFRAISSAAISSGALYSSAHILSSVAYTSGWLSSLAFGLNAISSAAISSGALSTLQISTAAWDQAANSVWTAARASYVSTLTMGYTQSTLGHTLISDEVWNNSTKILSSGAAVWSDATRTLTDLSSVVLSTASLDSIWTASTRSLTDRSSFSLSTTERDNIWMHSTRSLTEKTNFGLADGAITDAKFADNAISSASLSTAGIDKISSGVWNYVSRSVTAGVTLSTATIDTIYDYQVDSTITMAESVRLQNAVQFGLSTGGGTSTGVFYDTGSTEARITVTMTSDGNRNFITRDAS